ncbi:threonine kinase [Sphingomonas carotinifaciens]|nr:threonine kinase [Sphingomonas carotinifaciens]
MFFDQTSMMTGASRTVARAANCPAMSWAAPGTCGEFVQGRLDGIDYLINSPIDRFSTATVRSARRPGIRAANPDRHSKVAQLLTMMGAPEAECDGMEIELNSDLPAGKGMASSTADLVAAMGAAMHHLGTTALVPDVCRSLIAIEPSDCTHIPGVAHVGHLCGRVFRCFLPPSGLRVLILDCGGSVDTVAFDRARAHKVYARHEREVRDALSLASRGLVTGDVQQLADAATMSARLSQQILPKPPFEEVERLARSAGALGVNCAHSGSVLGILYRPGEVKPSLLSELIIRELGDAVSIVGDHAFISGGIYVRRH